MFPCSHDLKGKRDVGLRADCKKQTVCCYTNKRFSDIVVPDLAQIDQECSKLLQELVDLWVQPPQLPHHFNIRLFREYLQDHSNGDIEIHYIEDGYPLWLKTRDPSQLNKYVSNIVNNKRELHAILHRMVKEAKKGYIGKTLNTLHYNLNLLCVPKKNNVTNLMTEIRVARHGSFASKRTVSINSIIDKEKCVIPTLPNIRKYIQLLIKYKYVSLRDLKDAFRQLLVASDDVGWIQYSIFGLQFADYRQAYGVSSAAANCQHFAQILIWIFEHNFLSKDQINRLLVHIDDFLIAANSEDEAIKMAQRFDEMCDQLNVHVSHEKDETAINKGVVHGFGFDLITKTVYIPDHKFNELIHGLNLMINNRYATGRALESICGKIMHWSQLRKPAKALCYRLLRLIHEKIRSNPRLKFRIFWIPDIIVMDFKFWLRYSNFVRCVSMQSVIEQPSITITGATDASNKGGGFIIGPHYGAYKFVDDTNEYGINHRRMSINYQEAHAIIMLLYNYRDILTGRKLLLYIDNTSVMYSIYRDWAGSPKLMEYIQEIVLLMCEYRIELRVHYIPSSFNGLADALSRFDAKRFHDLAHLYNVAINEKPSNLEYYPTLTLLREGL